MALLPAVVVSIMIGLYCWRAGQLGSWPPDRSTMNNPAAAQALHTAQGLVILGIAAYPSMAVVVLRLDIHLSRTATTAYVVGALLWVIVVAARFGNIFQWAQY